MTQSRTREALALLAAMPGLSQAAAARLCSLHPATVSKAVAAQDKPRCACCGQTLRDAKQTPELLAAKSFLREMESSRNSGRTA